MADDKDFRHAVTALWERLALGPPRFTEPGRVRLIIENTKLDLIDNGRGCLAIEGVAATLSGDETRRAGQIRKVLETNLGLLIDNDVGVYAAELPSGAPALKVHASYSYSSARPDRLLEKIEDSVWAMEFFAKELNAAAGSGGRRKPAGSNDDQTVIFTP